MKNFKSLSALLLAVCLVLSMAVPAVWATDAVTYTYDFNYTTNFETNYLTNVEDAIAAEYDTAGSQQNWKFKEENNVGTGSGNGTYYRAHASFISESGIALKYLRVYSSVDGYIAFTVKTPTTGVYQVSLTHGTSKYGANNSTIYILDKDTTNITDAISEADANENVGDVVFCGTVGSADPASKDSSWLDGRDTSSKPIMRITDVGTWTADGDTEHILVFKATEKAAGQDTAYLYPTELTLTPVFATVGDQTYNDAASAVTAIAGAEAGTNVTINSDLSLSANLTTAANIIVARGATLDLAGKTLTAGEVNIAGALVDTVGDGLLVTSAAITCSGDNGGYLPLTDSTAGGYRLCKPTLETLGKVPGNNGTAAYWFHAHFENEAAYGYTGVEIGVQMTWDGGSKGAWAGETFMGNWATQVKADKDLDIKLTVTGLDSVTNFKLTPVIQANGVTISMNTL